VIRTIARDIAAVGHFIAYLWFILIAMIAYEAAAWAVMAFCILGALMCLLGALRDIMSSPA
jgi:hypothetical protein